MTPAELTAPAAPPAEPQYLITIAIQKQGADARTLEVRNTVITVPLVVENPLLARLIVAHTQALAAHDAGQLKEAAPEGRPN